MTVKVAGSAPPFPQMRRNLMTDRGPAVRTI